MNLHHQSVKTKSCLASDGHREKTQPNAIRYTRLKEYKWHGKKRNNLNIQAWKALWRAVVDSWGRIEQCFKHYKIKSQVYKRAVQSGLWWSGNMTAHNLILFIVLHVLATNGDSLPLLTWFTQKTHGCSICQDPVIPHWQLIVTQSKRANYESTAASAQTDTHPSHQSNAVIFNGFRCGYTTVWTCNYPAMNKNEHTTSTCKA